jgi:hypothetical protein
MRKPRDFDNELKTLSDKAKSLKERKVRQLGELVIATGADALDIHTLAGGLLSLVDATDAANKAGWRKRGEGFFSRKSAEPVGPPASDAPGTGQGGSDAPPGGADQGAP